MPPNLECARIRETGARQAQRERSSERDCLFCARHSECPPELTGAIRLFSLRQRARKGRWRYVAPHPLATPFTPASFQRQIVAFFLKRQYTKIGGYADTRVSQSGRQTACVSKRGVLTPFSHSPAHSDTKLLPDPVVKRLTFAGSGCGRRPEFTALAQV